MFDFKLLIEVATITDLRSIQVAQLHSTVACFRLIESMQRRYCSLATADFAAASKRDHLQLLQAEARVESE